jgi:hypothetical protein
MQMSLSPAGAAAGHRLKAATRSSRSFARSAARTSRRARRRARLGATTAGIGARTARAAGRAAWGAIKFALRVPPPGRTARVPRGRELAAAAVAGASLEYLLDPADGKRRRHVLGDRTAAIGRRLARRGTQRAKYAAGVAEGVVRQTTTPSTPPADDRALADRVRTEIFRPAGSPRGNVNVGAVNGVVTLRGEVPDAGEIQRLVEQAARVPGVSRVENLLHIPGTPAPTGGLA